MHDSLFTKVCRTNMNSSSSKIICREKLITKREPHEDFGIAGCLCGPNLSIAISGLLKSGETHISRVDGEDTTLLELPFSSIWRRG